LCNLLLQSALGIKVAEVAYRGTGPAMNDIVGGQIDFLFDQTLTAIPQIQGGTIKAHAVTSGRRLDQLKDLPTMQEAGLARFEVIQWHALYAPAHTPKPVLEKIGLALEKALKDEVIINRFADLGSPMFPEGKRGASEAKAMLTSEVQKWAKVIKGAGVLVAN
jgi:tripartite-type tricarboxylate transporter receptor subunit TctC